MKVKVKGGDGETESAIRWKWVPLKAKVEQTNQVSSSVSISYVFFFGSPHSILISKPKLILSSTNFYFLFFIFYFTKNKCDAKFHFYPYICLARSRFGSWIKTLTTITFQVMSVERENGLIIVL